MRANRKDKMKKVLAHGAFLLLINFATAVHVLADPAFVKSLIENGIYEGTWSSESRSGAVIIHFADDGNGGVSITLGKKKAPVQNIQIGARTVRFFRVNNKGRRFEYDMRVKSDGLLIGTITGTKSSGSGTFTNNVSVAPKR